MVGRGAASVMILISVGFIMFRATRNSGSTAEGEWSASSRHSVDVAADDDMDLCRFNGPRVGWVFGQLIGAETPGLAPTRREARERLMSGQAGMRFAVSPTRLQK